MTKDEIWAVIHARRLSVAELLGELTPEEWTRPSLCAGWSVHDVAAHLTQQQMTAFDEMRMMLHWRGSMPRTLQDAARRKAAATPPARIVAQIEATAARRRHTVGVTFLETLADLLIHEQDIAIPLGRRRDMPPEPAAVVATRVLTMRFPPPLPGVRATKGLRLVAEDVAWTHGAGPEVRGPMSALLLTCSGRTAALPELTGPGVAEIDRRLSASR